LIILIFVPRDVASGLAHASSHCVLGITLPPSNATIFSLQILAYQGCEEESKDLAEDRLGRAGVSSARFRGWIETLEFCLTSRH